VPATTNATVASTLASVVPSVRGPVLDVRVTGAQDNGGTVLKLHGQFARHDESQVDRLSSMGCVIGLFLVRTHGEQPEPQPARGGEEARRCTSLRRRDRRVRAPQRMEESSRRQLTHVDEGV